MKNKIMFYPPIISKLLASGELTVSDLSDYEKLSSILSERAVSKIVYLNKFMSNSSGDINSRFQNNYNIEGLFGYAESNPDFLYKGGYIPVNNLLDALTEVGNESINNTLSTKLNNYALRFKSYRIKENVYAVVYELLEEDSCLNSKRTKSIKDMEYLVTLVSNDVVDTELLNTPVYNTYLNLLQKNT